MAEKSTGGQQLLLTYLLTHHATNEDVLPEVMYSIWSTLRLYNDSIWANESVMAKGLEVAS
jgi:hypothetical protein